ncbi:Regulatory protein AfsR [Thermoflexales bacterium]|nr:Regulatory protein AfsR [Thermoflexales bacterium]
MSDNPSEPTPPAEAGTPTTATNISGGVNLNAQRDANIGGDVVGRDKTTTNIDTVGGAYIAGNVNVASGGEFVGRDKIVFEVPAPIPTSLHQLPSPPRDFTGREAELAELMAKAETDGVTISGLQGMGGVGKTTLALVVAEKLKPRYPDAQFYLDLKGGDKQPLSVAAALTHVIRAYQPTAKLPESESELRGLYLSVLEGQRALLLMDNAVDKKQVEPLIPPPSCFLLITSRQHFTVPGLFGKDLDTLSPYDARDLLLKIAPRIADQAEAMAKLCGYLPLALRLAGSAMAERQVLTPLGYLNRLKDAQTRLELVEASLGLSYDLLSEELQRAWGALSVFPDTFDLAAAATVWDVESESAQDRLDELVRNSLVEWNETAARARLHDLARLFANKRLGDAARLESQRRHATHYQEVSATADTLFQQGGDRLMQGLALFDLEWTNIQTGHAWATQYADKDESALSLSDDYPAQCADILSLRRHPRECIQWFETALIAARKLVRKHWEGAHLSNLGLVYHSLGESRRAIEYHEQSLTIKRAIGDRLGEGQALGSLGLAYYSLGEYRRTIAYNEQSLTIVREIGDRLDEGRALGSLGLAYYSLGEYRRAVAYHEQHLTIAREIGDRLGEAHSSWGLANCFDAANDRPQAIAHAQAALEIFTAIESPNGQKVRELLAKLQQDEQ